MPNRAIIKTDKAPAAAGTYSQAVKVNNTVYLSGQIGLDPHTQQMVCGSFADEVRQVSAIDPETGLSDLTGQLEDLTTRLETVETSVAEQGNQEDVTAVVAAEVGKFSEQIDELVASVRDLTTVVSQVQSDLDELQQRFDDHRGDPFGHNRGDTDPE